MATRERATPPSCLPCTARARLDYVDVDQSLFHPWIQMVYGRREKRTSCLHRPPSWSWLSPFRLVFPPFSFTVFNHFRSPSHVLILCFYLSRLDSSFTSNKPPALNQHSFQTVNSGVPVFLRKRKKERKTTAVCEYCWRNSVHSANYFQPRKKKKRTSHSVSFFFLVRHLRYVSTGESFGGKSVVLTWGSQ